MFGDGPIVLNERTLRLLGLSENGWNSLLLKSRLSGLVLTNLSSMSSLVNLVLHSLKHSSFIHLSPGGVLPLDTTFICFECGRDAVAEKKRLMKCKRCKVASYCDTNCQVSLNRKARTFCDPHFTYYHADSKVD